MEQGPVPTVVALEAALTIDHAADLRDRIGAALAASATVHLDFRAVDEIDLACLQILCAARSSARAKGKSLVFVGRPSERVIRRLSASGFIQEASGPVENLESAILDR
ncbi:MAG TPA: STAS domain-containing protein [Rectinemataceae bacterium]|nr:STAS domain-containing protein [Rectinemataceae bacterium]